MKAVAAGATKTARSPSLAEHNFVLDAVSAKTYVSGGVTSLVTTQDRSENVTSPAVVDNEFVISVEGVTPALMGSAIEFTNATPSVVDFDPVTRRATRLADGEARIAVRVGRTSRLARKLVNREEMGEIRTLAEWVPGSLARVANDTLLAAIAGKTLAADGFMYSNLAAGTRHPAPWIDADTSAISRDKPTVLALSDNYGLCMEHYPTGAARFVGMGGATHTATVSDFRNLGPGNHLDNYATDYRLVKFSAPLPSFVARAALVSDALETLLPSLTGANYYYGVWCFVADQERKALVKRLWKISTAFAWFADPEPTDDAHEFHEGLISGDSGSPAALVLPALAGDTSGFSHRLAYLTGWTHPLSGPDVGDCVPLIEAAIADMGGTDELTFADLSDFPTY